MDKLRIEEEAKVIIRDYRIVEIKKFKNVELSRNIRYIEKKESGSDIP